MKEYFVSATILAIASFVISLLAGFILTKKNENKFFKSKIFLNIVVWFGAYFLFVVFQISNQLFQILVMLYILYKIRQDALDNLVGKKWFEIVSFSLSVLLGIVALWMLSSMSILATIAVIFGTIYAACFEFVSRKKFKQHPISILKNIFSWERLLARLFGSLLGVWLVSIFVGSVELTTALLVFLGSSIGEWLNTFVKRQIDIKKWSEPNVAISGVIDSFCGIGFAALAVLLVQYF